MSADSPTPTDDPRETGGSGTEEDPDAESRHGDDRDGEPPATDDDRTVELDVRTIDGAPFDDIMAALDDLDPDERLVLINSFEPEPLYDVLDRRGFDYEPRQVGDDEWRLTITRE